MTKQPVTFTAKVPHGKRGASRERLRRAAEEVAEGGADPAAEEDQREGLHRAAAG